jgi:hypothetical protein
MKLLIGVVIIGIIMSMIVLFVSVTSTVAQVQQAYSRVVLDHEDSPHGSYRWDTLLGMWAPSNDGYWQNYAILPLIGALVLGFPAIFIGALVYQAFIKAASN